jgi:tight adherence protein B
VSKTTPRPGTELDAVASVVQRLAVLLAAGVTPVSGWRYLAEQGAGPTAEILSAVAAAAGGGGSIADAIVAKVETVPSSDAGAWRGLAAAWSIATDAGASLAPSLQQFAGSLRSLAQTHRDIHVALAAPTATARMVIALPAVGMVFGLALGFDTFGTLLGTVPGLLCLGFGIALILLARAWNRKLVRAAGPTLLTPGLTLDLMAIAVSGGGSIEQATIAVAQSRERYGLADEGVDDALASILSLSRRAGVPAATLLQTEAEEARRSARSDGERTAATLSVTLMLPLGLCILPAFMLLGVAPLVITVISSTMRSF